MRGSAHGLGEVALDKAGGAVTDVEIDTVCTQSLHFMINGARDNISGRQLGPRVEAGHEPLAILEVERGAFAAQSLGD